MHTVRVKKPAEPVIVVILAALGMIGPFSIDTVFPAFEEMALDLAVPAVSLQQLISVYLLAFAGMSLFHGPISDAVGRKRVVLVGIGFYTLASVAAAFAPSLGILLVARAVQGASAGAGQIVSRAVVRDLYDGERAQKMMATISMIFGLGPAIAPVLGGALLHVTHWRGIFWFLTAYGVALFAAAALLLPETHPTEKRSPLDVGTLGRNLWTVASHPTGFRLALASTFNFAGMFLYISAAPIIMFDLLHAGSGDFGLLFIPLISGMVVGSWVSGRLAHIPARRLANVGYAISLLGGTVNLAFALSPATQGLPWAVAALPFFSFGVAIAFPILTLAMLDEFPHVRGAAASVQSFFSLVANALIAAFLAPALGTELWHLALGALLLMIVALLLWQWHLRATHHEPTTTRDPQGYEPLDEM